MNDETHKEPELGGTGGKGGTGEPGKPGRNSSGGGGAGGVGGPGGPGGDPSGAGGQGGPGGVGGDVVEGKPEERHRFWSVRFWTATGVVKRWQFLSVFALVIAISVAGFSELQARNDKIENVAADNRVLIRRLGQVTRDAAALARTVAQQRIDAILLSCREQNDRHKQAVDTTLTIFGRQATPNLTARQRQVRRVTIIEWVTALVPKFNCKQRVTDLTDGP